MMSGMCFNIREKPSLGADTGNKCDDMLVTEDSAVGAWEPSRRRSRDRGDSAND